MKIILASASKRRIELLKRITQNFQVIVSDFDEKSVSLKDSVDEYVKKIALGKAMDVEKTINYDSIIIGADTIVVSDNKILGKPENKEEAFKMLQMLSGTYHYVYSGIALINTRTNKKITESVKTKVTFSEITKGEIEKYIESGEPMDKAGAYGIQGAGGVFVEGIEGCFYNVVGLPLNKLKKLLNSIIQE